MILYYVDANHTIIPLDHLFKVLNPEEINTCLTLDHKYQYAQAMSYMLQRYAISTYARYTRYTRYNLNLLKDIPITRKPGHKPYFTPGGIHYSVSHTKGHIFVLISDQPCGLDIECQRASISDILHREFGIKDGTIRHWTMVESCLKYHGCGLAGIKDISFNNENYLFYKNKSVKQIDITAILPKELYGTLTF